MSSILNTRDVGKYIPLTNQTILDIFESRAAENPEKTAVEDVSRSLTFNEVLTFSRKFARIISSSVPTPTVVVILLPPSYEFVVAQIAVLISNCLMVPLDVTLPEARVLHILEAHGTPTPLVITNVSMYKKAPYPKSLIYEDFITEIERTPLNSATLQSTSRGALLKEPICLYTSGTTGSPKGVLLNSLGLLNFLDWNLNHYTEQELSRSLFYASPGSDMAFTQIWPCLCANGTVVIPPLSVRKDIPGLLRFIHGHEISFAFLPSIIAPYFLDKVNLRKLKILGFAGERVPQIYSVQLPPNLPFRVEHHYGLTECSIGQTFCAFEPGDKMTPSVGRPIQNTQIYVLREDMSFSKEGEKGQVFVGGLGVCRYHNLPDIIANNGLWPTKDIGFWRNDGTLEISGRMDEQVKICGTRVEVGEVEAVLANYMGITASSIVVYKGRLWAFAVGAVKKRKVFEFMRRYLPEPSIPSSLTLVPSLPLTKNGKVDKRELANIIIHKASRIDGELGDDEKEMAKLWGNLLSLDPRTITRSSTFYAMGGNSILATALLNRLTFPPWNVKISFPQFLRGDSLSEICHLVTCHGSTSAMMQEEVFEPRKEVLDAMASLRQRVGNPKKIIVQQDKGDIFLTGATGYFTPFLLQELIKNITNSKLHHVNIYCLIRAEDATSASSRLDETLLQLGMKNISAIETEFVSIIPVAGDFSQPSLGIQQPDMYTRLCNSISHIYHCGAETHQYKGYAALNKTNVAGMLNIIQFCLTGRRKILNYISTLSVLENRHVPELELGWQGPAIRNGYSQSKWVAEKVLTEAADAYQIQVNIYRLGSIGIHSVYSPRFRIINSVDIFYLFIRVCSAINRYPVDLEWPPYCEVDVAAKAVAHISVKADASGAFGKIYHIGESLNGGMRQEMGCLKGMKAVGLKDWVEYLTLSETHQDNMAGMGGIGIGQPFETFLTLEWFLNRLKEFSGNYFEFKTIINPELENGNSSHALEGSKISLGISNQHINKYIQACMQEY